MGPPNILLITTDEHNARAVGYAGDPTIRTPNIDRLAREGMVFHRAYTTQALCTPARASIFTGQHVSTHGVRGNIYTGLKKGVRAGSVTFTKLLQQHGYETALIGKRHLGFENESDIGLDHQDLAESKFDFNPPGMTDDYRRWLAGQGYSKDDVATWTREDMSEEYWKYYGAVRFPLDEYFYVDSYLGRQAVAYLKGRGEKPFFLWLSFCSPHHPWDPPARYDDMYDPDDIVLPERLPRELHSKPKHQLRYLQNLGPGMPATTADKRRYVAADEVYAKIPEEIQRKMIARYYGTISLVDDRIGHIIATLEETGLWGNTIVLFTSDHGDHLAEHYLFFKGSGDYDSTARVPFVVRKPDNQAAGQECHELVSLFDLAPTFLEWAGADVPDIFDGLNCQGLLDEPRRPLHNELFVGTRVIVTREWKYVYSSEEPELYNLVEDPKELVNRAGRPEHEAIQRELLDRLRAAFGPDLERRR